MLLDNERISDNVEPDNAPTCCHHWVIQPAVGPVSEGECQKCGEVKEFKNSIDYETEWTARRELARSESGGQPAPPPGAPNSMEDVDEVDEIAG